MKNENPLMADRFDTPFESFPFENISPRDFKPAVQKQIENTQNEIQKIADNKQEPDFKNTIEALEFAGTSLDRLASVISNLNSAETNKELQEAAQEIMPLLTRLKNDILLNSELFEKVKKVYENKENYKLDAEQRMLLEKTYKGFIRNGALLNEKDQQKLREIDQRLTKLKLDFSKNVLEETNAFQLLITDKSDLEGLPEEILQSAEELAHSRGKSGWMFILHAPSYIPFMKYAKNRELRKKMSLAYGSRAFKKDKLDNREIVSEIAKLRKERAVLLGFDTHAHFILEERMARNPGKVMQFLEDLYQVAYPAAKKEMKKLKKLAAKDGIKELEKWDLSYYMENLKKQELDLDEEQLRPYFPLEKVLEGIFDIAGKLYDLKFEEIFNLQKYHPDVRTFKVTDNSGEYVALLYVDFFPREGKRPGAWMTSYNPQWKRGGEHSRPHISIVTNFSKPSKEKPALLTFNELTTLFHEFGHALHGMLADTRYPSLSGTNVYWDFVELPSQIMENWAYEKEALKNFARHYQSGEVIPDEMITKIKKSMRFMEAYATTRQLGFGFLDMAWHYEFDKNTFPGVVEYEKQAFEKTRLVPYHEENNMSVAFSHIFPGGYSAGYYSYKWAEVLDADAFSLFQEKGIFDKETATKFKILMQKGGTEHPMELYKKFRGREPQTQALLKRAGLLEGNTQEKA